MPSMKASLPDSASPVEEDVAWTQADRATGDLEHVDDRPGQAAARFVDRSHSGGGDRRVEDADTKAGDDKAEDTIAL